MSDAVAAALGTLLLLAMMSGWPQRDTHDHRPREGGIVTEIDGTDYELVITPDSATLFAREGGKPIDISAAAATLTLTRGTERVRVAMSPVGGERLQARGNYRAAPGSVFIVMVTRPGRASSTIRYAF